MNNNYHHLWAAFLLVSLCLLRTLPASADDTEIFFSESVSGVSHNVMFIIDGSGSMDTAMGNSGQTRLDVMKGALETVLGSAPDNLNVGLMNYGEDQWRRTGHGVKFPISPIDAEAYPIVASRLPSHDWGYEWWLSSIPEPSSTTLTVRDYLSEITSWYWKDNWYSVKYDNKNTVDMVHKGATPIVDALYEAALYFRGAGVGFGLGDAGFWTRWAAHPSTYTGDLVKWDNTSCPSTYTATHNKIKFWQGDYAWYTCKSPFGGNFPAHYLNCKFTENCFNQSTQVCNGTISGGYCRVQGGELSLSSCPPGEWVTRTCSTGWETTTVEKCSYDVCNGFYGPQPTYVTPIKQECQNNYIVLLSDGKPGDGDDATNQAYRNMENGSMPAFTDMSDATKTFNHTSCASNQTPSGFRAGICGPELTHFLSTSDNSPLDGEQRIQTYAVGFGLSGEAASENYLKSLVTTDDGSTPEVEGYFSADDQVQLSSAFKEILAQISSSTTSFAAPGYSVNTSNGLSNESVVYVPVFDKNKTPRWNGNLKKFTLGSKASGDNVIKSKDGSEALNELGVFADTALDLWSKSTIGDGAAVTKGGAASLIDPNTRLAVSDLNCSGVCDLTATSNLLTATNAADGSGLISNTLLGLGNNGTPAERQVLVNYIRGRTLNSNTGEYDLHPRMGDMLHTEPVVVTYENNYQTNASVNTKYNGQVVFAATNEGYLHAFDTTSGEELFAFMPSELLKNIQTQYLNTGSGNHAYGIDGNMSLWRDDVNKDGVINADDGDKAYLYFGLRRGGRSYYALDVTNPEQPKLLWKIKSTDTNFSKLGQSWSTPYLVRIRTGENTKVPVVVFTGGYDLNQDNESAKQRRKGDDMGNDVFIVNALTGSYIWSIQGGTDGSTPNDEADELTHSTPGGVRLLDMNGDGAIDRMYFADTKAQIWRLELPTGPSYDLDDSKLIKFAELSKNKEADARMIYNEPDVGIVKDGKSQWLTVSVGSGYRAHPANEEITDHFYMILDDMVYAPLVKKGKEKDTDFETIEVNDLVKLELKNGDFKKGKLNNKTVFDLGAKVGWYFELPEKGEKVLANSITSNGSVMFTTLVPGSGSAAAVADPCVAPVTQGRFYSFNVVTGSAGNDLDKDGEITDPVDGDENDLFTVVAANEIPGRPQTIFNDPTCIGETCQQIVDIRVGKKSSPVTNYDSAYLESLFWTNPRESN